MKKKNKMIFNQPINYTLVTDATSEPITLNEVRNHLRIDGIDYDAILTPLIKTVRQIAEKTTGRDMINKTWRTYLDCFPSYNGIEIKKSKLQSITSIKYYINDVLTTQDSNSYYFTDEEYSSIEIKNSYSWASSDERKQAVQITFVAGYGADATFVPQALKQAMLSHVAFLYENAGDCVDSGEAQFKKLYFPYILPQLLVSL